MYCKVCFDAGKPEEVFTSHTVKNQFGMVTCVTLLEHNCESCGCIGHTPKYCPAVKTVKKFCPFCKDIGGTYTDHNMWENGLIVCEELLSTQCTNCGDMGHTPKYCTAVKFCPVCRDAGRDYDHDLTIDDVVVCEYLLSLECGNCGELGHTRKYCTQPPPKFCPVCKDAGNDHKHDLMRDGVVVCEYLLGLECGNCGEIGHTPKYCTMPRRKTSVQKLQEGNNLASRLEIALMSEVATTKGKNKGAKKKYLRVL